MEKKRYMPPVTVRETAVVVSSLLAGSQSPYADSKGQDFFEDEDENINPWSSENKADGWRGGYNPW